jgi:hypothetical protein
VCPYVLMEDPLAGPSALPCQECPEQFLDQYMASPGGRLISLTVDLDFALRKGIAVKLEEISYLEFRLLALLAEERDKYEVEEIEKQKRKR